LPPPPPPPHTHPPPPPPIPTKGSSFPTRVLFFSSWANRPLLILRNASAVRTACILCNQIVAIAPPSSFHATVCSERFLDMELPLSLRECYPPSSRKRVDVYLGPLSFSWERHRLFACPLRPLPAVLSDECFCTPFCAEVSPRHVSEDFAVESHRFFLEPSCSFQAGKCSPRRRGQPPFFLRVEAFFSTLNASRRGYPTPAVCSFFSPLEVPSEDSRRNEFPLFFCWTTRVFTVGGLISFPFLLSGPHLTFFSSNAFLSSTCLPYLVASPAGVAACEVSFFRLVFPLKAQRDLFRTDFLLFLLASS